jgi:type IV secretion system protein VirB9
MRFIPNKTTLAAMMISSLITTAHALEVPTSGVKDPRIQHVMYDSANVVRVNAAKGVSLLIMLDPSDPIDQSSTGVDTDCKDEAEWCIVAPKGGHLIWVKPYSRATYTDMQLTTQRRVYSFEFKAQSVPRSVDEAPTYRLVFDYPPPPPIGPLGPTPAELALMNQLRVKAATDAPLPMVRRNMKYTMQAVGDSSSITPSEVFDDGRFTYLKFPNNQDVPAVFAIGGDGTERQVDKFWEKNTDYMVLEKVYARLVLRKDKQAVELWNNAYDANGVPPEHGTTVNSLSRELK